MATDHGGATADVESAEDPDRPRFRGCVFCYAAEWVAHGVRRVRD
jgi:hypothetical protein